MGIKFMLLDCVTILSPGSLNLVQVSDQRGTCLVEKPAKGGLCLKQPLKHIIYSGVYDSCANESLRSHVSGDVDIDILMLRGLELSAVPLAWDESRTGSRR